MAKKRRGAKSAVRHGIYAVMDYVDPFWFLIFDVVAFVVTAWLFGHEMGMWLPFQTVCIVNVLVAVLWVLTILFFGHDDSAPANADAMKYGECWTNMAEISHRNTMHGDHH
jgi:hypothetical protein